MTTAQEQPGNSPSSANAPADRFEVAVEAAGLGVFHWDVINNTFEHSPRARAIYGFPAKLEVTYDHIAAATHPDDLERNTALLQRSLDPEIRSKEGFRYRIRRVDTGEIRWVLAHGHASFAERDGQIKATHYTGTIQDITEQANAEEALAESEARLRLAVEGGGLAVWELDLASNRVTPSAPLNRLYGFPDDAEPSIEELRSRYAPGEQARLEQLGAAAVSRGETKLEAEVKHIWPDGTVKWLLVRAQTAPPAHGSGPRVIGVVIDITEAKRAEEALKKSENRLRMSQQAAGIASLELDVASGNVIGSELFWPLWGLSPRESVHISVLEGIVIPEDKDIRSTPETRKAGTAVPSVEYRIRRPDDGALRWLSRTIEFIYDEQGRPAKMFGVMQDITERKEAQGRQEVLTHELEHRIKNILATVGAIASQTLRNGDLPTARKSLLDRIQVLAQAHDLLNKTRWTQASMQGVVAAALAPHLQGSRITFSGPEVQLGPRRALSLALAVNELATNSLKHGALSGEGGKVEISWTIERPEGSPAPELRWIWQERDGPSVVAPARRGFGSFLIERVLATDFEGTVRIEYGVEGVLCVLTAPVSEAGPLNTSSA